MELLIRVVDKAPGVAEPELGIGRSRAGNVISACQDGWAWSKLEIENPDWRVVRADLTKVECDALLSPGDGDPGLMPVPHRRYFIDFENLPPEVKQEILDTPYDIVDVTQYVQQFRLAVTIRE